MTSFFCKPCGTSHSHLNQCRRPDLHAHDISIRVDEIVKKRNPNHKKLSLSTYEYRSRIREILNKAYGRDQ
jgi:hypothetical protein